MKLQDFSLVACLLASVSAVAAACSTAPANPPPSNNNNNSADTGGVVTGGTVTGGTVTGGTVTGGTVTGGTVTGGTVTGGTVTGGTVTGGTVTGGTSGTGGATSTAASTTSASGEPLGGYHVHGNWAGFAFTFADGGATITPESFNDMVDQDGPYCVSGTVEGTEEYTSIAAVGFNTSQPKIEDAPVNTIEAAGSGLYVDLAVNGGDEGIRIQIEDGTDPMAADAAEHRWCVNLTGSQAMTIPWESFNTECWSVETGTAYDGRPIAKVIAYVPDPGLGPGPLSFDFCINDIGPADVMGRGTGEIVASCGENVSWNGSTTSDQFINFQTSDNRYQFQSNGWGWQGGGHTISLLPGVGFHMDSQTCSRSDDSPCSFPSVYIGTDADGERTSGNGLPAQISAINSIPTCLGWSSGGTPASDEYNVAYDVWFNSNSGANYAEKFLMVWFRDPPSFQPAGMFPEQDGVVIGDQTWSVWFGPNANNQDTVSYAAPNARADGQAYSFNLKDFIDDAVERGHLDPSLYLISVMGGMEIWGGASGASIDSFSAQVQ